MYNQVYNQMYKMLKIPVIIFLISGLMLIPFSSSALAQDQSFEENSSEKMFVDFLFLRPLGIVVTAVGTVMFIASLPFSASGGNINEAFLKMMAEPAKFTFARPLGDLSGY
ncbi:MAG: multidrug transporter [Thermodesulfobacteriota bacterium]|nr:multidrug transporter [Thermodesulfobacteriota bacterium]